MYLYKNVLNMLWEHVKKVWNDYSEYKIPKSTFKTI